METNAYRFVLNGYISLISDTLQGSDNTDDKKLVPTLEMSAQEAHVTDRDPRNQLR